MYHEHPYFFIIQGDIMKTIVIYKSKAGFVKKYAEWIAEELSADLFEASKISIDMLKPYEVVIYGGGLYAVGINGIKFITENFAKLKDKKIVVFATGASTSRKEAINDVMNKNFTPEQKKHIQFFYLRGGFNYRKLKVFDKFLMTLLKFRLKRTANLTPDEKGMLAAYDNPADFTNKKNIEELISYVNS